MTLFGMCVVDVYLLHKECSGCDEPPNTFFWKLAAELIDQTTTRSHQLQLTKTTPAGLKRPPEDESPPSGIGLHVTPTRVTKLTKTKQPTHDGVPVFKQGVRKVQQCCTVCGEHVSWTCSHCRDKDRKPLHVHHPQHKPQCWRTHKTKNHDGPDADLEGTQLFDI